MPKQISIQLQQELIAISRKYGSDSEYVLAGGGNTSCKENGIMAVKASGSELATIDADGFVKLDLEQLHLIRTKRYPDNNKEREAMALQDLMNARLPGETGRPSVESLLHAIIPDKIVVHTHPALVNALTCSVNGKNYTDKLFHEQSLWISLVDPGYILAKTVDSRLKEWIAAHNGQTPDYIFLENHGIFLGGENTEEIDSKSSMLLKTIKKAIGQHADITTDNRTQASEQLLKNIAHLAGTAGKAIFTTGTEIREFLQSEKDMLTLLSTLSPDHIVYMGYPTLLYDNLPDKELFQQIANDYRTINHQYGKPTKTILIRGKGIISVGTSAKSAETARDLTLNAIKIAQLAENFGGTKFMAPERVNFINTWEVETFRARQAEK